jgi:hypothetical protein
LTYTALLGGIMLSFSALAVPFFMMMNRFNLVNTFAGLILPQIAIPPPVIVFKQFFDEVPRDFRDGSRPQPIIACGSKSRPTKIPDCWIISSESSETRPSTASLSSRKIVVIPLLFTRFNNILFLM